MVAVGWGLAAGAALSGLLEWGLAQALEAWFVALLLAGAASGLLGLVKGATAARWGRLPLGAAGLPPAWPPSGSAPFPGARGFGATGPGSRRASGGVPGGCGPCGSVAAWGLGLLVGALVAAARIGAQASALGALTPPRVAWVAGFAAQGWEWRSFTARTRLGAVRLAEAGCPGAGGAGGFGPALPGQVEVVVPDWIARRRPVDGGEWVCVRGLVRPPPDVARTGRSLRRALLARGVVATVTARLPERVRIAGDASRAPWGLRLRVGLIRLARRATAAVRDRAGPDASAWFAAVALGDRQALGPDRIRPLQGAGLSHLTSVSGMHVGLVGAPLLALSALVFRRRWTRLAGAATACVAGWAYAVACGLEAPAVRALLMQGFALLPALAGWRPHLLATLGWAAAAQLIFNPHLAGDAGFQMSYAATAGIALATRHLAHGSTWPPVAVQVPPAVAMARRLARKLAVAVAVSAGAWLFSAPVAARHFGWSSVWGIVVSVPAGVASLALIWSGFAAAAFPPPTGAVAAAGVRASAAALEQMAVLGNALASRWPLGVSAHAWTGALMATGIAGLVMLGGRFRGVVPLAAAVGALAVGPIASQEQRPVIGGQPSGRGWVMVFHEGQGAGWAMVAAPDPASRAGLASGLARAMATTGGSRLRAVVVVDRRPSGTDLVEGRLAPAAAGAVLIRWDAATGRLWARPRPQPFEQAVAGFVVGTTRVQPDPGESTGSGWPLRLLVIPAGEEVSRALRIDARGCVEVPEWPQPVCAAREAFRLDLADEGWERWP